MQFANMLPNSLLLPERGVALLKQNPSLYWLILAEAANIAQGKEQQTQETVKKP